MGPLVPKKMLQLKQLAVRIKTVGTVNRELGEFQVEGYPAIPSSLVAWKSGLSPWLPSRPLGILFFSAFAVSTMSARRGRVAWGVCGTEFTEKMAELRMLKRSKSCIS